MVSVHVNRRQGSSWHLGPTRTVAAAAPAAAAAAAAAAAVRTPVTLIYREANPSTETYITKSIITASNDSSGKPIPQLITQTAQRLRRPGHQPIMACHSLFIYALHQCPFVVAVSTYSICRQAHSSPREQQVAGQHPGSAAQHIQ
jgi:hypothetical protein